MSALSARPVVPASARTLAPQLAEAFDRDQQLAVGQNHAQQRLQAANDRLWWGLHPDGIATLYDEHPAAFAEHRSEVLGAEDPLAAIQQPHWQSHRSFCDYQAVAEDRRHLAAEVGELIADLVAALVAAGWTEDEARNANVRKIAASGLAGQQPEGGTQR